MNKFRILSIDGGGLRGVVPLRILQEIELLTGRKIHQMFDMIVGTSTGGLIASCLTIRSESNPSMPKYTLDDLMKMYTAQGSTIFPIRTAIGNIFKKVNNLYNPEFSDKGIDKVLKMYIGEQRIKDSLLPILISTYDVNANRAVFFKTSEATGNESANARVYDVCRATSAAPTFLPAYSFTYKGQTLTGIDGGVFINNPTMAALAEISKWGQSFYKKYDGSILSPNDIENVCVLSLGTGSYSGSISNEQAASWGQLQWVTRITDIMMKGVNQSTNYEANEMVKDGQYLRLDIVINEEKYSDMTDAKESTRNYLLAEVDNQVLRNEPTKKKLQDFLWLLSDEHAVV